MRSGYAVRRTYTSLMSLGEAVRSWAVAHHGTGRKEDVMPTTPCPRAATITSLLKPAKPATLQQLKRGSPSPAGASHSAHLPPQHPALFSLPFPPRSAQSPGAPTCQPGSHQLQTQHKHLECVSRRPLFLYKFWGLLCCDPVFSFPGLQKCS